MATLAGISQCSHSGSDSEWLMRQGATDQQTGAWLRIKEIKAQLRIGSPSCCWSRTAPLNDRLTAQLLPPPFVSRPCRTSNAPPRPPSHLAPSALVCPVSPGGVACPPPAAPFVCIALPSPPQVARVDGCRSCPSPVCVSNPLHQGWSYCRRSCIAATPC
jgi:hypothetical protein